MSPLDCLARNGYWVLFVTVLAEQLGLPIPAIPVLVAMGALAGGGGVSLGVCLTLAVSASVVSDTIWYRLGRMKGQSILKTLCKVSLEPDSCVSVAKDGFESMGSRALFVAKFIPGFSTVAPAMAGVNRIAFIRFLAADGAGATVWAGASLALGFLFRSQVQIVMGAMSRLGSMLGIAVLGAVALYVAVKWFQRYRFIRFLRASRITAAELVRRIKSGEPLAILDLRRSHEVDANGAKIPGALSLQVADIEKRHQEIPRDRDIVLYCHVQTKRPAPEWP